MLLAPIDWAVLAAYVLFALTVGIVFAKRAGKDVNEYFLSGRTLPWWIAGTSMVATTFAADTPLVITGWVRDYGIWQNWLWMCYAAGGFLTVFVFARYWRRGNVMTTAQLAELRYGGNASRVLRGFLGFYHAGVTNTIVLCWVLLAAAKIMDVLLDIDKTLALSAACLLALAYSLLAGFWGVVLTDLVQFAMAMVGAILLASLSWDAIGGSSGLLQAAQDPSVFGPDTLKFFPAAGEGGPFSASFWSTHFTAACIYLGVAWWAAEAVDGGGLVVQRISATRDERQGVLAALWYNIAHYALRPWPWILVALASIVLLPTIEVRAPVDGTVRRASAAQVAIQASADDARDVRELHTLQLDAEPATEDWQPLVAVTEGQVVRAGDIVARTDSERAYVVMMGRFLPAGLLGLVVASLLAAFMSTIDTHVNLASSFFVNDVYRRFVRTNASAKHYVQAARAASAVVLALAALMASQASSISSLFTFFLAFLGGVGPVYVLRWLWWRVRASTEIAAMLASSSATVFLSTAPIHWNLGPLSDAGALTAPGRLCLVAGFSALCALGSMLLTRTPDPAQLVEFYRLVRPAGAWHPVRALCPDVAPRRELGPALVGVLGGLATTYGLMLATGFYFLERSPELWIALGFSVAGACGIAYGCRAMLNARED